MGRQRKSKKREFVGKGKVTPLQIAFIVDRYLSDNSYAQTRTSFRSEASDLISKSSVQEAPKSLLSLEAILDEYITLKETKVWVNKERRRLAQEKLRVQNLLSGMQGVIMDAYNSVGGGVFTPPLPLPPPSVGSVPISSQADVAVVLPAGYNATYNSPAMMMSASRPSNTRKHPTDLSTPVMCQTTTKRKESSSVSDGPSKKYRRSTRSKDVNSVGKSNNSEKDQQNSVITSTAQSSACDNAPNSSPVLGCNVVKCLINLETPYPPPNSSVPETCPRPSSSQAETSTSPLENCSTATSSKDTTPQQITSYNRTIISSETIHVSPVEQISYYSIEKNHTLTCSPSKTNSKSTNVKEHVKGTLDFGTSELPMIPENQITEGDSTSEFEKEGNILDFDFPTLDALGVDFNLSEFLFNFGIGGGSDGVDFSSHETFNSYTDSHSGSPPTSQNLQNCTGQVTSEYTSTISEFHSEKDTSFVGTDTVAALRSVTKCVRIVSPVKSKRQFGSGEPVQ